MKSILILLFFPLRICIPQTETDTTDYRKNFQEEILLENSRTDEDNSVLLDKLEDLKRDPLDLNKASSEQLEVIPFLSSVISKRIIDYRKSAGSFSSKRELLKIEGISDELYEKIKVYLIVKQSTRDITIDETGSRKKVKSRIEVTKMRTRLRSSFFQELQPKKGYLTGKYEGRRLKLHTKLNSVYFTPYYKLEANLTIEKDPGEKSYADFVSGFIQLSNYKFIKELIAGDYSLTFGQGLSMWNSQYFSKGIEAVSSVKRKGKQVDGYTSTNEVQFFRGIAARLNFNKLDVSLYYSDNYYDATIDTVNDEATGFYYDGYHRTTSEIRRKNSLKEKLAGGRLSYDLNNLRLGATLWTGSFSRRLSADTSKQLYKFTGNRAGIAGFDYDLIVNNMNFAGEISRSQNNSIAHFNLLQFSFYKFGELILSYRNYPPDFIPVHSSGFGERGSETGNEQGFYAGITLKPLKGLTLSSYYDQYKFPYRTFFDPVSVSGNDFLFNCQWRAAKGLTLNIKYKNENKEELKNYEDENETSISRIDKRNQINVRAGFIYQISDGFRLRSRYEYVNVDYQGSGFNNKGMLFFSDVRLIPIEGFSFDMRVVFFDTDDYDSRLYEFENDIKGVMSNIALYGKGRRWYALLKYKPLPFVEISGKYAETYTDGARSTGSGNDEIIGDINNKLSAGIEIVF